MRQVIDKIYLVKGQCNIWYLDGKIPTLIDTGSANWQADESELKELQSKVKQVINTHCHFDHTGGNGFFKNAKIMMHELDANAIADNKEDIVVNRFFGGKIFTRVDRKLKHGDIIQAGDSKLKVVHTPGHTAGSICLYDEKNQFLFSGDTLFAQGYGRTDLPTGNESEINKSLLKLKKINFKMLFPGHGNQKNL